MIFTDKAKPLTRQGLPDASRQLEMSLEESAALWAVFEVETAGSIQGFGFRSDKRPQMLFERHKFREFTGGQFSKLAPDLSRSSGGPYGTISQQYPKLERALILFQESNLGEEPALKSASWGIGQIMGFNHLNAGFTTAKAMVQMMIVGEDSQLLAMTSFM